MEFNLLLGFVEEMKKFYGVEIGEVDYQDDIEIVRKMVNVWVVEKMKQKIQNMIFEGVFSICI